MVVFTRRDQSQLTILLGAKTDRGDVRAQVIDGTDELQHKVADVLRLQRALADTNGLVEVAITAQLQDHVLVVLVLEVVDQVDNVRVSTQAGVDLELAVLVQNCRSMRNVPTTLTATSD